MGLEKMSFEILEKSPQVAPLLVRLYDTHNLYSLAGSKHNKDARQELTTIMVDLMSIKLSDRESELITDVLFALMKQAEAELKIALSERLSALDNIPLRMILGLANDDISIAEPVLRSSPVLHDMDLMYILQAKGATHGRVIAQRAGLSATIINMLAETRDFETAVNLCGNDGAKLTNHAFDIIAKMAKQDKRLAAPLLKREDVPADVVSQLYEFVGTELKRTLSQRFGKQAEVANKIIDEMTVEMDDHPTDAQESMLAYANLMHARGELKIPTMISALRRGQPAAFVVDFSVYCALPIDTVRNIIRQETGKGLAIACRAFDISKADFVSIYLLTERFRNHGNRVVGHAELSRIMTMFDEINPDDAKRTIKSSRH